MKFKCIINHYNRKCIAWQEGTGIDISAKYEMNLNVDRYKIRYNTRSKRDRIIACAYPYAPSQWIFFADLWMDQHRHPKPMKVKVLPWRWCFAVHNYCNCCPSHRCQRLPSPHYHLSTNMRHNIAGIKKMTIWVSFINQFESNLYQISSK